MSNEDSNTETENDAKLAELRNALYCASAAVDDAASAIDDLQQQVLYAKASAFDVVRAIVMRSETSGHVEVTTGGLRYLAEYFDRLLGDQPDNDAGEALNNALKDAFFHGGVYCVADDDGGGDDLPRRPGAGGTSGRT